MKTGIILYDRFSEYELSVALSVLQQGGKEVVFIGLTSAMVKGEAGLPCLPETTVRTVDVRSLDSLLLPGVDDMEHLVDHLGLNEFLKEFSNDERWIGAISSAPYFLAKAGLLKGKSFTCGLDEGQRSFLGVFDHAFYRDKPVVVDSRIVTARGSSFIEFALTFADVLGLEVDESWYRT
ncbi:DJ-1/PfpI family protein [Halobacillus litoralis]|uniref:DJ-1/PfpI family protein n=1 Tax=Halobacillus litoralis TaxID=45668 RepID=UPI001CD63F37|nr:DJ-1/PfpI family protein [Halobacillus litoralis]MCA0970265.1 DJ-1/PfpI family protein [Halobacillus litoralis]